LLALSEVLVNEQRVNRDQHAAQAEVSRSGSVAGPAAMPSRTERGNAGPVNCIPWWGGAEVSMDSTTRFIVGLILLIAVEILFSGTVVFLVRRWRRIEPAWSWPRTLGAFFLLGLVVTGAGLIPMIGRFAAVIVSLVGLKRISGLDVLSTFILSFCMGIAVFAAVAVISNQLQVDLLVLR
jgi:hypothetical protein